MYKLIAFDLDGTIAETFPVILASFRQIVLRYTGRQVTDQEILATFGANEVGMLHQLIPNPPSDALEQFYQQYRQNHRQLTAPFPGILNLLKVLKTHQIRTPLVTGKGEISCQISLASLKLTGQFAPILTGSAKGPNKAANFKKLLNQYQLSPSQMAYVADTVGDINACQEVGINCYSAAWSVDANADRLRQFNPNVFISPDELVDHLLKRL
ncbi:HAD family hydrolase [Lentilactobacillus raoultii]|uniref:HAD family hydrolase n=1 Tax=Lentilactobacillus raoultii TaxID=1987503 RepID=A0ABW3PQC7_9LACO|nr:HAD hydrolase-like protein [Lentilactobacillus raoultii]